MNGSKRILELAIALLLGSEFCCMEESHAAFLDNGTTARGAAWNGAYVATVDGPDALLINPAGLASLTQPEAMTDYSRLYTGLADGSQISQSYLGAATPLNVGGSLACGWKQLSFAGLYSERVLALGYGRWLTSRWAGGAVLKQLHVAYSPDDQVVDDFGTIQQGAPDLFAQYGTARTAYSSDLGALYRWTPNTQMGLAVQDLNEPNIALSDADEDRVKRTFRIGMASDLNPGFKLATGLSTRQALANTRDWIWSGGGEQWFHSNESGQFGARGSLSWGTRAYRQIAMGASYRAGKFQLDYAFTFNLGGIALGDTYGNHRFCVAYRFGKEPSLSQLALASSRSAPAEEPVAGMTPIPELEYDLPDPNEIKEAFYAR